MTRLAERKCVPCGGGEPPAGPEEIERLHRDVPDWRIVERDGVKRLERAFTFDDFASALEFTNRVGEAAEDAGHHPVVTLTWGEVAVTWWTHATGGLHANDFIMADRTDALYGRHSAARA